MRSASIVIILIIGPAARAAIYTSRRTHTHTHTRASISSIYYIYTHTHTPREYVIDIQVPARAGICSPAHLYDLRWLLGHEYTVAYSSVSLFLGWFFACAAGGRQWRSICIHRSYGIKYTRHVHESDNCQCRSKERCLNRRGVLSSFSFSPCTLYSLLMVSYAVATSSSSLSLARSRLILARDYIYLVSVYCK